MQILCIKNIYFFGFDFLSIQKIGREKKIEGINAKTMIDILQMQFIIHSFIWVSYEFFIFI